METRSTMRLELGTRAPDFELPDASGRRWSLRQQLGGTAAVVAFVCNHCPFVKHVRDGLGAIARDYSPRGVAWLAINSNDFQAYPDDAPARMPEEAARGGWEFPYLVDESQQVAKAWGAACTPDFFVLDAAGRLFYRGQMDASRPGNGVPVTGADLRAALDAALAGRDAPSEQRPSVGCNIKWKPGNAPEWFGS